MVQQTTLLIQQFLVSGDGDFVPAVRSVKRRNKKFKMFILRGVLQRSLRIIVINPLN